MTNKEEEQLAKFAKALGHPTRVQIINYLATLNQCCFGDIHAVLPIAKATASQHLKELREAGLIQGSLEAPKVKYCIDRENWELACKMFNDFFQQELKNDSCGQNT